MYSVSNLGNVKSHKRKSDFLFASKDNTKHYVGLWLMKDKKRIRCKIHRLVAELFIPNPENKPQVNHKNGDKQDNRAINLEWATRSENLHHAYTTGLRNNGVKRRKLKHEDVIQIRNSTLSNLELSKIYKVSKSTICDTKNGRRWNKLLQI